MINLPRSLIYLKAICGNLTINCEVVGAETIMTTGVHACKIDTGQLLKMTHDHHEDHDKLCVYLSFTLSSLGCGLL